MLARAIANLLRAAIAHEVKPLDVLPHLASRFSLTRNLWVVVFM